MSSSVPVLGIVTCPSKEQFFVCVLRRGGGAIALSVVKLMYGYFDNVAIFKKYVGCNYLCYINMML